MDKAIEYARRFLADPRIIPPLAIDDTLRSQLPEWWQHVLLADGGRQVGLVLERWKGYRDRLPTTFEFLRQHLNEVRLLQDRDRVRLLYELEKDGETMYYAGGNPLRRVMNPSVARVWDRLPASLRQFYDSLHDGWCDLAAISLGPAPTEHFFILDDQEWGVLEDIGDPGCDLKDLVAIYTNGAGGYVAISVSRKGDVLWWKDRAPRLNIDLWAVMDAWTEIGLNN